MCKECVQTVVGLWAWLRQTLTCAHDACTNFFEHKLYTGFTGSFRQLTHMVNSLFYPRSLTVLSTLSTVPITTTIYIYNNKTVGGLLKERV